MLSTFRVESEAATEASALAEMRAKEISATVLEAKELVSELKGQEGRSESLILKHKWGGVEWGGVRCEHHTPLCQDCV